MKSILIVGFVSIAIMVASCSPGGFPRDSEGRRVRDAAYGEICLNGVVYYTSQYRLTPKFLPDSTVETCN
jgi:hypothetical protein